MIEVRTAEAADVGAVAAMAEARRVRYEAFEPQFWKRHEGAEAMSRMFFGHLATKPDTVFLLALEAGTLMGFLIAQPAPTPPVYDAGRTAVIDDFCVAAPGLWTKVGPALLAEARSRLKAAGIDQIVVVSGFKDDEKMAFLQSERLRLASAWWTARL